jgi:hypothetical protein
LDRGAHDLGRVDDALGDEVHILAGLHIEAERILLQDLAKPSDLLVTQAASVTMRPGTIY